MLYVAGCPSHRAAVDLVKGILLSEGLHSDVSEILVRDQKMAEDLRFRGSPTIRINGRDVDDLHHDANPIDQFSLSCRLYVGSHQIGLPSVALVRRAIAEARTVSQP